MSDRPACECGAAASWHGDRCGQRVFCCAGCFQTREDLADLRATVAEINRVERLIDWDDKAKNWEDI